MADTYLSTADVAFFNKTDMNELIVDALDAAPFLARLAARTCRGNSFVYTKRTANPVVGFRAANDGVETKDATYSKVTVSLGILDASFAVDVAVAQSDERGWMHILAEEGIAHMKQAMREVEEQIINGTNNVASNAFSGFADQTNLDDSDDTMVVNAGGTTASTGSSVYLVNTGPLNVEVLWGQEGVIEMGETQIVERAGSATGRFPAYYTPITGWCGVKIGSTYSVSRICNLTADSGKGLTDDLISSAIALHPIGYEPNLIVMNRRSWRQLQQSRTATNPVGSPAPFPESAFGIPIVVTDSIGSTETLLTAA